MEHVAIMFLIGCIPGALLLAWGIREDRRSRRYWAKREEQSRERALARFDAIVRAHEEATR